jgi:hypothetical protein
VIKTFATGILLGVAGAVAALHYIPVIDVSREVSIIAVTPNGGNSESFHINVPSDRIMVGADNQSKPVPQEMHWPKHDYLRGSRTELFKVRNSNDVVIGVASRLAIQSPQLGDVIEWVLHLPARGTMYVSVSPQDREGLRSGTLMAGTREFDGLVGGLSERWIAGGGSGDEPAGGRIELVTTFVADAHSADAEGQE